MCIRDSFNTAFLDGSKFEADANKYKFVWKPTKYHQKLSDKIRIISVSYTHLIILFIMIILFQTLSLDKFSLFLNLFSILSVSYTHLIASIKNLMKKMAIPLDKAMDLLDLSSIEKEEMKKHFQS